MRLLCVCWFVQPPRIRTSAELIETPVRVCTSADLVKKCSCAAHKGRRAGCRAKHTICVNVHRKAGARNKCAEQVRIQKFRRPGTLKVPAARYTKSSGGPVVVTPPRHATIEKKARHVGGVCRLQRPAVSVCPNITRSGDCCCTWRSAVQPFHRR